MYDKRPAAALRARPVPWKARPPVWVATTGASPSRAIPTATTVKLASVSAATRLHAPCVAARAQARCAHPALVLNTGLDACGPTMLGTNLKQRALLGIHHSCLWPRNAKGAGVKVRPAADKAAKAATERPRITVCAVSTVAVPAVQRDPLNSVSSHRNRMPAGCAVAAGYARCDASKESYRRDRSLLRTCLRRSCSPAPHRTSQALSGAVYR